ncbi:dynein regulatory complex protein 9 isoform X1 [Sceloporus undulatus]|uniref:dynein regulatory complex protein 9 isoform X1 n=1 Tax=Sceloporus undulatus TaxID=8520 RepID=UPI001C4B896E|nr:dynein regulatory complex protein 9 isoform X1 [Sceloporus undulatus]
MCIISKENGSQTTSLCVRESWLSFSQTDMALLRMQRTAIPPQRPQRGAALSSSRRPKEPSIRPPRPRPPPGSIRWASAPSRRPPPRERAPSLGRSNPLPPTGLWSRFPASFRRFQPLNRLPAPHLSDSGPKWRRERASPAAAPDGIATGEDPERWPRHSPERNAPDGRLLRAIWPLGFQARLAFCPLWAPEREGETERKSGAVEGDPGLLKEGPLRRERSPWRPLRRLPGWFLKEKSHRSCQFWMPSDNLLPWKTAQTSSPSLAASCRFRMRAGKTSVMEMMGRKKVKSLQKQLSDIKREKDYELQNRNEMVAYLKDQLQEMKAKTEMENRYVKKDRGLQVAQVQKKCAGAETDLLNEIEKLRNQIDQEMRVHSDIENFLKQQQVSIEEKLEYWVDKYEKETEAKQQELNALKSSRAADQAALQELARQCLACEQAIIEDRKEKENARKKVERDALEMKSILKLQAWWKGMMVRRFLGPYKALKKLFEEEQPVNEKGKKGKGKPGPKKKK